MKESIEDEVRRLARRQCDHVCHKRRLNPWIKECPTCGCGNPKYDPDAVSDIEWEPPMSLGSALGMLGLLSGKKK